MGDIVLNFAIPDGDAAPVPRRSTVRGGRWTQVLKEKRQAKVATRRAKSAQEATRAGGEGTRQLQEAVQTLQDELQSPKKHSKLPQAASADDEPPAKKAKGKAKAIEKERPHEAPKPSSRPQVISSLFSAEPLPAPRNTASPSVLHAPSNAALRSASVAAPELHVHPCIAAHLGSERMGITAPTGIQALAWSRLLDPTASRFRDVILQSQTGSGKTLAYLIPIIQDLLTLPAAFKADPEQWRRDVGTLAVVLVPTRELAEQVLEMASSLLRLDRSEDVEGDNLRPRWLVPGVLHGGTNRTHEKARLRKGLPLLICTPGRLLDHLEKTSALRLAGGPAPSFANAEEPVATPLADSIRSRLCLRWLVVDEADRLMDMGFEEQMRGIIKHLDDREVQARRFWASRKTPGGERAERRTVLCSATIPERVQTLVGIALKDPVTFKGSDADDAGDDAVEEEGDSKFSAPAQLSQRYAVMPPKLRLVSLLALLRQLFIVDKKASKVLVFVSCTDSVDFHFEALGGMQMGRKSDPAPTADEEDANRIDRVCSLLPNVRLFRLHGSLNIQMRLKSLRTFSQLDDDSPAVLFCTSVASRGLDVPFVSHVIQYDLPTEGGVKEYLHRVGRTARAGNAGEAWSFLLPSEEGWVDWCSADQRDAALAPTAVDDLLRKGFGGKASEWETRATDVQMAVERWVSASTKNSSLARHAFASHVRAYATHPADEKHFFHVKNLHLGHLAKSFGLREAPADLMVAKSVSSSKKRPREDGFEILAKQRKTTNTLRGLVKNTADEFNVGSTAELEALVRKR